MNDEELHRHHHQIIAERSQELAGLPSGRAALTRRRRAAQHLYAVLDGHLRRFHGRTRITGAPQTLAELHRFHRKAHQEES